jgi:hypothetical protein
VLPYILRSLRQIAYTVVGCRIDTGTWPDINISTPTPQTPPRHTVHPQSGSPSSLLAYSRINSLTPLRHCCSVRSGQSARPPDTCPTEHNWGTLVAFLQQHAKSNTSKNRAQETREKRYRRPPVSQDFPNRVVVNKHANYSLQTPTLQNVDSPHTCSSLRCLLSRLIAHPRQLFWPLC